MKVGNKNFWSKLGVLIIGLFYLYFLAHKILITRVDLGRYLKEGELFFETFKIVDTNYYTYTYPDFSYPNHHWLSSPFFYLIENISGFKGLHIFSILLSVITLLIFIKAANNRGSPSVFIVLLLVPLMAYRTEIRPEIITIFFISIYYFSLTRFSKRENISTIKDGLRYLWFFPLLSILWVNFHVYFFVGWVLILLALMQAMYKLFFNREKEKIKIITLVLILLSCIMASFFNPFVLEGVRQPFVFIFDPPNPAFILNETRNLWSAFTYYGSTLIVYAFIMIVVVGYSFTSIPMTYKNQVFNLLVYLFFSFFALSAIRNISIMGFVFIPILINNIDFYFKDNGLEKLMKNWRSPFLFCLVSLPFFIQPGVLNSISKERGIGLESNPFLALDFFKTNKIKGPIFNNYGNAGYLIYGLFPEEKLYTLNKYECYPNSFFENEYFPALYDMNIWNSIVDRYGINTIFFKLYGEKIETLYFLGNLLESKQWVLIYEEKDRIAILVKNNIKNKKLIDQYNILDI